MIELNQYWIDKLISQPETGMGYQVVTIVLRDGTEYKQAIIDDGKVTQIKGYSEIPFKDEDIKDIIVTNDKWNFNED